jgi:DNA-binding XRE family transcriptional regulator
MLDNLGIKRTTWNGYEAGTSQPYLNVFSEIAEYFGITMDDLLNKDLTNDGNLNYSSNHSKNDGKGNLSGNPKGNLSEIKKTAVPNKLTDESSAINKKTDQNTDYKKLYDDLLNRLVSQPEPTVDSVVKNSVILEARLHALQECILRWDELSSMHSRAERAAAIHIFERQKLIQDGIIPDTSMGSKKAVKNS